MADTPKQVRESAKLVAGEAIDEKGIMIAMLPGDTEAYKAADVATQIVVGINDEVALEGEEIVANGKPLVFGVENGGDVTKAHIRTQVYVVDEKTVSVADPGNSVIAGTVVDVDDNFVYISPGIN